MKTLKKLFALVATVATCLSLGATSVLADEPTTGSITINNATGTYAAYQVFAGKYDSETKKLNEITWGTGVNAFEFPVGKEDANGELIKDSNGNVETENTNDPVRIAAYLAKADSSVVKEFASTAIDNKKDPATATATATSVTETKDGVETTTNKAIMSDIPMGYYVVENSNVADGEAYTKFILEVAGDATATNKTSVPTMEKKVMDTDDSDKETAYGTARWDDSADYDIGDAVPFKLSATVADNYDDYKEYYFTFHDVEETGLTFDSKSVTVKVDGTEITTGYTVNTSCQDGDTFEVVFSDLKKLTKGDGSALVEAKSEITVEYKSTLNENAVVGSYGNVNKAQLEYSNNPNAEQEGTTGKTPWDNVIVFTYEVVVNKIDENNRPLKGAEFTLYKYDAKSKYQDRPNWDTEITAIVNTSDENVDIAGTIFTFRGLDAGTYKLVETKAPTGYNKISDITFTVNADHSITWNGTDREKVLTSLNANVPENIDGNNTNFAFSATTIKYNEGTDTEYVTYTGDLSTTIINKSGTILPSTGGIGTTVFYVTGAILMLGAGVLLVSRKRVSK